MSSRAKQRYYETIPWIPGQKSSALMLDAGEWLHLAIVTKKDHTLDSIMNSLEHHVKVAIVESDFAIYKMILAD